MNTRPDILALLKVSDETLADILQACGWSNLEEFSDDQGEMLLAVNQGHEDHEWSYVEGYMRNIAHQAEVSPEEFDQLATAIQHAGGILADYRDQFKDICEKFKTGNMSPELAIMPNSAIAEPVDSFVPTGELPEIPGVDFSKFPPGAKEFIKKGAEAAAVASLSEMQGLASVAAEVQESLMQYFIYEYVNRLGQKLQDPQFEANFLITMRQSLEGNGKKTLAILTDGVPTPVPMLSSNS